MANTSISNLSAGAAVSATDLLPNVQTAGVGPVKTTAAQLKTFMSASPTLVAPVVINEAVGSSALTLTGATQTSSFPVLSATQRWNNAATTFTALKLNITNTTSAAGSLLLDLQVGGTSQFQVRKDGAVTFSDSGGTNTSGYFGVWNLGVIGFGNAATWSAASVLTAGLSQISAGIIGVGTGAQGSIDGGLQANSYALRPGTAIPAGGTAGFGFTATSATNFGVFFGSGAPSLAAAKGSLYLRSDGSGIADRAYINTDGSTTWAAIATTS